MNITTHAQRCAEIAEWARNGWLISVQIESTYDTVTKTCVVCGREFEGQDKKKVCGPRCFQERAEAASREQRRRDRA